MLIIWLCQLPTYTTFHMDNQITYDLLTQKAEEEPGTFGYLFSVLTSPRKTFFIPALPELMHINCQVFTLPNVIACLL